MNIHKKLGIKYPILQGGMANIASGAFAAAVSNAGALGTVGSGGMRPDRLEREIDICRSMTDKPFAVNLVMVSNHIDELVDVIVKHGISYVTVGAGSPHAYMGRFLENNIKVLPLVSSPSVAKRLARTQVEALIAEGSEAGGHIGELTTMTLIPQTVAEVDVPVVAAGGIASGRQMLAAEILGAAGVQMGTALLFTEECPIHQNYKDAILKANSSRITVIGRSSGMPIRLVKNDMTKEYQRLEKEGASLMELEHFTLGAL
ncbi:MAG: nitronate monooxygenase, partial [Bacillota bacterium]|nr:nitronate monooxygenase [Bacillota bacterium]